MSPSRRPNKPEDVYKALDKATKSVGERVKDLIDKFKPAPKPESPASELSTSGSSVSTPPAKEHLPLPPPPPKKKKASPPSTLSVTSTSSASLAGEIGSTSIFGNMFGRKNKSHKQK